MAFHGNDIRPKIHFLLIPTTPCSSSKVKICRRHLFLLHPFSCCLNSFFGFFWDALHFQTVASTPNMRIVPTPQWRFRSRFFRVFQRWPRGEPANHSGDGGHSHLGPRKCWHKSNGSVNIHSSESHVVVNSKEKINQRIKVQKHVLLERISLHCVLIWNKTRCDKNISSTSFWPPCGFSK